MSKQAFLIALSFMSVVVGGGFASGQETLQFFTGYGIASIAGTLVSGLLFAFLGMQIARMSSGMQASSHKEVLDSLFGKQAGLAIDLLLSFFLFGVGVVMLAGSGSIFVQQYDMHPLFGGTLLGVLVIGTLCLRVTGMINLISAIMPVLLSLVLVITGYSFFVSNASLDTLEAAATEVPTISEGWPVSHWLIGAVLYASFNIAVGFPMLAVIGGMTRNTRQAMLGGALGGIGLGVLIFLLNIGLFANLERLVGVEMPSLVLGSGVAPWVGDAMSLALICMIYSTAVGMFFAFTARFAKPETGRFKMLSVVFTVGGLVLSQFGFSTLIGTVYPMLGVLGLILIIALGLRWKTARRLNFSSN